MQYFTREIILDPGNKLCNHHTIFVWWCNETWVYTTSDRQFSFIPCLYQTQESMTATQDADPLALCAWAASGTHPEHHCQL